MSSVRFESGPTLLPHLLARAAQLALMVLLGSWSMRLLAPAPLAPPVQPLQPVNPPAPAWRNLFLDQRASALHLELRGVITRSLQPGLAVISIDGGTAHPFAVGETLAPGIVLGAVDTHGITLLRQGLPETLELPVRALNATPAPTNHLRHFSPAGMTPAPRGGLPDPGSRPTSNP